MVFNVVLSPSLSFFSSFLDDRVDVVVAPSLVGVGHLDLLVVVVHGNVVVVGHLDVVDVGHGNVVVVGHGNDVDVVDMGILGAVGLCYRLHHLHLHHRLHHYHLPHHHFSVFCVLVGVVVEVSLDDDEDHDEGLVDHVEARKSHRVLGLGHKGVAHVVVESLVDVGQLGRLVIH